jgi:TetR/AcrR family transcriptional regulator
MAGTPRTPRKPPRRPGHTPARRPRPKAEPASGASGAEPRPAGASSRRGRPAHGRPRRPGPAPTRHRPAAALDTSTRSLIFDAAANEFSTRGFDGASVDAIAGAAHVNKAMLYYHFGSKLGLYREIVAEMLRAVGAHVTAIAASDDPPARKIARFIEALARQKDARPWFPPLMLREMSEGAPHLDDATLTLLKAIFGAFAGMLNAGTASAAFRRVHPVLAYMSIMGPMMMNAVRERAAAQHGRLDLPLFAPVPADELLAHMQDTALRMLDAAAPSAGTAAKDRP